MLYCEISMCLSLTLMNVKHEKLFCKETGIPAFVSVLLPDLFIFFTILYFVRFRGKF